MGQCTHDSALTLLAIPPQFFALFLLLSPASEGWTCPGRNPGDSALLIYTNSLDELTQSQDCVPAVWFFLLNSSLPLNISIWRRCLLDMSPRQLKFMSKAKLLVPSSMMHPLPSVPPSLWSSLFFQAPRLFSISPHIQ